MDAWWVALAVVVPLVIAVLGASAIAARRHPRADPVTARVIRIVYGGVFLGVTAFAAVVAVLGLTRREWMFAVLLLITARMAWISSRFLRSVYQPKAKPVDDVSTVSADRE